MKMDEILVNNTSEIQQIQLYQLKATISLLN